MVLVHRSLFRLRLLPDLLAPDRHRVRRLSRGTSEGPPSALFRAVNFLFEFDPEGLDPVGDLATRDS